MKNANFLLTSTDEQNFSQIKKKIILKNERKKKLTDKIKESNKEKTFIKVNKLNHINKPNKELKAFYNKNKSSENISNNDNEKILPIKKKEYYFNKNANKNSINKDIFNCENKNLKSKIIQRIQKEKNEKIKPFKKIRVKQNESNNKEKTRSENDINVDYIGVNTILKKEKEKNIKNKDKNKNKNNSEKKMSTRKSCNNNLESKKRKLILMKELINIPSGKRRNILEIIKKIFWQINLFLLLLIKFLKFFLIQKLIIRKKIMFLILQ